MTAKKSAPAKAPKAATAEPEEKKKPGRPAKASGRRVDRYVPLE